MRIDTTIFRSKFAQRMFALFILCAALPMAALAILSFSQVTKQLSEQSWRRLRQASKSMGMGINERLVLLETEMKMVVWTVRDGSTNVPEQGAGSYSERLARPFKGVAVVSKAGESKSLFGSVPDLGQPTSAEWEHLRSGATLLSTYHRAGHAPEICLTMILDPERPGRGVVRAAIESAFLWGLPGENPLPPSMEVCILDQSNRVIFSTHPVEGPFLEQAVTHARRSHSGRFEWAYDDDKYIANYWSLFLKAAYYVPTWTVVTSESRVSAFSAMADFTRNFVFVLVMTVWVVLLLSIGQIRKRLVPLERLLAATRAIARSDFTKRVRIKTGDELEALADSFNSMAERLGKQFNALTTIAEIDREILSTLDTRKMADALLYRMGDVLPCDDISVILVDKRENNVLKTYVRTRDSREITTFQDAAFTEEELHRLQENPETLILDGNEAPPRYLQTLVDAGSKSFVLLPIFVKRDLSGIVSLGSARSTKHSEGDLLRARQVVDQVAVALSNARLIDELDQLNWGTLTALGWTIDARSHWTAGHSKGVVKLALKLGRELNLSKEELDNLHRGALLHDIGKIGVPSEILDKPGKLTPEERRIMQEHVLHGARILEPITAYAGVLPIVRQHHEWYDGSGYPFGLVGEEIDLKARIFAVADCFDALLADRPYRPSVGLAGAIDFVRQGARTQFDPRVVEAFLALMEREATEVEGGEPKAADRAEPVSVRSEES